jgi:hypothetical protein
MAQPTILRKRAVSPSEVASISRMKVERDQLPWETHPALPKPKQLPKGLFRCHRSPSSATRQAPLATGKSEEPILRLRLVIFGAPGGTINIQTVLGVKYFFCLIFHF